MSSDTFSRTIQYCVTDLFRAVGKRRGMLCCILNWKWEILDLSQGNYDFLSLLSESRLLKKTRRLLLQERVACVYVTGEVR